MIFGRPIAIWIILLILAYSAFGTVLNLASVAASIERYGMFNQLVGLAIGLLSAWLIVELWLDRPRQVPLSWALFATISAMQIYGIALYVPIPDDEMSTSKEYIAITIFTAVMVAIYALVPWYLTRRKRKGM